MLSDLSCGWDSVSAGPEQTCTNLYFAVRRCSFTKPICLFLRPAQDHTCTVHTGCVYNQQHSQPRSVCIREMISVEVEPHLLRKHEPREETTTFRRLLELDLCPKICTCALIQYSQYSFFSLLDGQFF